MSSMKEIDERNCYDILGITKNATKEEIRQAFLKKFRKYHPDRILVWVKEVEKVPSGVMEFLYKESKKILDAYNVLSDDSKKEEYDKEEGFN